ncbi:MAG: phosphatidylglycerophosphatase A, partial [Deltaproteobacteria bacterium]|nr:phosphatidylglycerophosphatase A [Deltaproteobacteria bacterium]
MNFRDKSVIFFATGCFIGNIPFAPGTFGTILGLPLCFLLTKTEFSTTVFLVVMLIAFAILIAHYAEKILKKNDPGCIIIDEIIGIVITFIGLK